MGNDFPQTIQEGAELLDMYFGSRKKWINKIDVDSIDMESNEECIIGQLFGDFWDGTDMIFNKLDVNISGYDVPTCFQSSGNSPLGCPTSEWKAFILEQQANKGI